MASIESVAQRVRRDFFMWRYNLAARQVLATAAVSPGACPFVLLSMVQSRDVLSYLVAVKSFAAQAKPSRIVVVCDPSISGVDRATILKHVPHVELRRAEEFQNCEVPRGGTWERLTAISEYATHDYVVQLDADTVTSRPIPEVLESVQAGHGFVLGESPGQKLLTLGEARTNAAGKLAPDPHVVVRAEFAIAEVGLPRDAYYVRGCSGFTGFPRTDGMREKMIAFSRVMSAALGQDWSRWGTEQVTSNYLVANAMGTAVLPFPKYGTPDVATRETVFCHYIGTFRFVNSSYEDASRRVMLTLS